LPVDEEDGHDTPNPDRHFLLGWHKEELAAVGAVVEAIRISVLPQHFATMSAGTNHDRISGAEPQKRIERRWPVQL
jgi:hypothetical protein